MTDIHREVLFCNFRGARPELFIFLEGVLNVGMYNLCLILKTVIKIILCKAVK